MLVYVFIFLFMTYLSICLGISMKMSSIKGFPNFFYLPFLWPIFYIIAFCCLMSDGDLKSKLRIINLFTIGFKAAIMLCMCVVADIVSDVVKENALNSKVQAESTVPSNARYKVKRREKIEANRNLFARMTKDAKKNLILAFSL